MDWMLLVVVTGLGFSFLFSGSETALSSLGRLEAQRLMAEGGQNARLVQRWVRDPNGFLVTVLVGNNLANAAATSLFAIWAASSHPQTASILILGMTLFMILFAEILPKIIARGTALSVAPFAVRFLTLVHYVLWPISKSVRKISAGLAFASGMPGREARKPISEDELSHTIEIAAKEGGIDHETGEALSNLIDFPDRVARDIMTPRQRVQAVSIKWSQDQVVRFLSADGHSRYPVVRESLDELVGVLLVKDILSHIHKGSPGSWTKVVRRPYLVSELAPLGSILRDMKRSGTHLAIARNETGVVTGLLTLEDLIEEIVGEIRDEHDDPGEAGLEAAMGGPRLVNGEISILDFNDRFDVSLPMDITYSTLNGYLLTKTGGALPPLGTLIVDDEVTFRIHAVSDSGIATVEVLDHVKASDA
jgi:putative hemolysin